VLSRTSTVKKLVRTTVGVLVIRADATPNDRVSERPAGSCPATMRYSTGLSPLAPLENSDPLYSVPTLPSGRTSSTITSVDVVDVGLGVGVGELTVHSARATSTEVTPSLTVARQEAARNPLASTRKAPALPARGQRK